MKLALLGLDDTTLAIARAALRDGRDEVALVCDLRVESVRRLAAEAGVSAETADWESLLYGSRVDAVVVARAEDQELRAEQLRKLVQAGIPLLISHPVLDSMLVCYELDMIRNEAQGVVLADLWWRWHPATKLLRQLIDTGNNSPLGVVGQATFERTMNDRTKSAVLAQFACDVDLIRHVGGDVTRLGAMGSLGDPATYANLGVQMSGPSSAAIRWSVGPVEDAPGGRLTVVGDRGKAVLQMPDAGPWRLEIRAGDQEQREFFDDWSAAAVALEKLRTAIAGRPVEADWSVASRSVELAEAIDRSLARGRTIELHDEEFTDVGTFKGTMTSVGCGLLIGGLVIIVVLAVLDLVARQMGWQWAGGLLGLWPYVLLGLLGLFLAVQLVLKVAAPGDSATKPADLANRDPADREDFSD